MESCVLCRPSAKLAASCDNGQSKNIMRKVVWDELARFSSPFFPFLTDVTAAAILSHCLLGFAPAASPAVVQTLSICGGGVDGIRILS